MMPLAIVREVINLTRRLMFFLHYCSKQHLLRFGVIQRVDVLPNPVLRRASSGARKELFGLYSVRIVFHLVTRQ